MEVGRIFACCGEDGITEYVLGNGVVEISDDMRMPLFMADGLLPGTVQGMARRSMGYLPDL